MEKNRFIETSNIHDAILILYPKISRYELEVIAFLLRHKDWARVRKIAIETVVPRVKIYGVAKKLLEADLIEEKLLKPILPEYGGRKRRAQAMRDQGFEPRGEASGFKVFRVRSDVILERLNWLLPCLEALQSLLIQR